MPNPIKKRLADLLDSELFMPRELSWLSFNARVLQEAADESVPIIERLRYLGIYSNNADEFFRVRVAEVRRLIAVSSGDMRQQSKDLLVAIQKRVLELQKEFDRVYIEIMHTLAEHRIYLINEKQLDSGQAAFVRDYFTSKVLPELEPILLSEEVKVPVLTDESIYLAVDISTGVTYHSAVVEVPTDRLSRFVQIPRRAGKSGKGSKVFIVLDNIIRACLPEVFRGVFTITAAEAYCFKFSRDAELAIDTGISQSLIDKMALGLKRRQKGETVRMVYDANMPQRLLDHLCSRFGFSKQNTLVPGGRYHNSKDFMRFPNVGSKFLEFKKLPAARFVKATQSLGIFESIRKKDVLLYFPYHRYGSVIDLLKTAALDPHVTRIKICLYRVAKDSRVIDALVNAVQNGKKVLAVVELAARFDEAANINWAQRLTENGIEVVFGIPGLKVHSKLLLIERREDHAFRYYSYISNGNFNENTARRYTDFSLVTYDQNMGKDVNNVFEFLQYNYKRPNYRLLMVAPHSIRSGLLEMINQEIANVRLGHRGFMTLKCNNLVDKELVMKLYEASQAGVEIRLIVRGMCSLLAGVKDISENIQAISIVDRYLEHARIYMFHNRGKPRYLMGSADLMTRNLDFRVEVLCPILDEDAKRMVQDILDQQWHDNVKARVLDPKQTNLYVPSKKNSPRVRSQESIHAYLETGKLPRYPKLQLAPPERRRRQTKT
jgi:polyphosphate kinase